MTSKIQLDRDGFPKPDYEKMIGHLQGVANTHYREAVQSGVHAFIEHTGIMNEHLKLLHDAAEAGLQVEHINVHGSERFPMEAHQAAYIGEKFACIFAPYFTKETFEVFAEQIRRELREDSVSPVRDPASGFDGDCFTPGDGSLDGEV